MTKETIESFEEIIEIIIDLEPSENKIDKITEYDIETPEDKINKVKRVKIKETIKNGLDELKLMEINKIKELEEIEWKLMCQKVKIIKQRIKNKKVAEFEITLKREIKEEIKIL